ncbi:hypothetical protein [Streptococcus uberis]|uniref:hypothetical protein n=1 Tax=Streptococcus uberis TaxID=1349 RepID=UPI0021F10CB6|nr:hypothetical protein [Streptococcus uberis]MCV6815252.1 hypothetical protein [Streptococcus uberis]MCZ8475519.1 hypothetical protein [Streptococcus uberis]
MTFINSIYNFFKKTPPPPQKRPLLIFGRQLDNLDGFLFDNVLPWANDTIPNTELSISDLIFLWVISRFGQDFHSYPTHLSRNYGVTKPMEQVQKLINLGLVDRGFMITELGIKTINKNRKYIELHKNGWTTPEEKKYNKESDKLFTKKYAEWLLEIGLTEDGNRALANLENANKRDESFQIFQKGEMLGKSKNYMESNLILLPLLENDSVDFYAPLYERIAKNYRGLKEYQNEIDICQKFLNDIQPLYGEDMWIDIFAKRINFAISHIK